MPTPNYELLKDAYAIIDGIPESAFNLRRWRTAEGESLECGTICCAAGWLAQHPDMVAKGLSLEEGRFAALAVPTLGGVIGFGAMSILFGIERNEADAIFSDRCFGGRYQPENWAELTDKEIWKARVRNFLKAKGAL